MRSRRWAVWAVGLVALSGCGIVAARALGFGDAGARRALYDEFPLFPGASEVSAEGYRIESDGRPTGDRGLRVAYELPGSTLAADVIGFYRASIPAEWTEVSDATCAALLERMPAPPRVTALDGTPITSSEAPDVSEYGVMSRESQLTVFTPGETGAPDGSVEGVTFRLERRGASKYVVLDEPDFACGPPAADPAAVAFDQ
jgi:hypothetical protein